MSKFNVHGSAEQKFPAEQFKLRLTVESSDGNAGESIRKSARSMEQLLQALSEKLNINPEDMDRWNDGGEAIRPCSKT